MWSLAPSLILCLFKAQNAPINTFASTTKKFLSSTLSSFLAFMPLEYLKTSAQYFIQILITSSTYKLKLTSQKPNNWHIHSRLDRLARSFKRALLKKRFFPNLRLKWGSTMEDSFQLIFWYDTGSKSLKGLKLFITLFLFTFGQFMLIIEQVPYQINHRSHMPFLISQHSGLFKVIYTE